MWGYPPIKMNNDLFVYNNGSPDPLTSSVRRTAALLGVSCTSVYRLLVMRKWLALKGLRTKRITNKSIQDYLDGRGGS